MSLNLRNEIVMEVENAGKFFRAHFPAGSSYQECFDALTQFANKILEMSKAYESTQTPADKQSAEQPQQEPSTTTTTPEA